MSDKLNTFCANESNAKRKYSEEEHAFRSPYERDRDRILYSKGFRRLNRKTQVFVSGFDDHARNRLTHTIEVAQISQTIAGQLGLNIPLTQAIAYGHDVGHTPFGHVGERTLNHFMNGCFKYSDFNNSIEGKKGFKHNWQGIRVFTYLERISDKYCGLNLSFETLWGILNHTGVHPKECHYINSKGICQFRHKDEECSNATQSLIDKKYKTEISFDFYKQYEQYNSEECWSIEGLIVRIADEIAQRHHDLEDGFFAKILTKDQINYWISKLISFASENDQLKFKNCFDNLDPSTYIYSISSILINTLTTNVINNTRNNILLLSKEYAICNSDDFYKKKSEIFSSMQKSGNSVFDIVNYSLDLKAFELKLQEFLKYRILNSNIAQSMDGKSSFILRRVIYAYLDNPQQLPDNTIKVLFYRYYGRDKINKIDIGILRQKLNTLHHEENEIKYRQVLMRTICDFIAGMTDDFAIHQYNVLYGTTNVFNNHK